MHENAAIYPGAVEACDNKDNDCDEDIDEGFISVRTKNITVQLDESGNVSITAADVDEGSSACGDNYTLSVNPDSFTCADVGPNAVTLTVTDNNGNSSTCNATVTVVDSEQPVITCNAPGTIVPRDIPVSFTATATDNCGVASVGIIGFDCFKDTKEGKEKDKKGACQVQVDGDTITILDSGGVGNHIEWTVSVTDVYGNTTETTCGVDVVRPSR